MNPQEPTADRPAEPAGERNLLDLVVVLAQRKRLVLGLPVAFAIVAAAASLALPNIYSANTKMLPPQQAQSGAAALLAQLGGVAGQAAAGVAGVKNPNDLYIGMLKSRTLADRLVAKFDLKKVYGEQLQEGARAELASNTLIVSGKDGLINVTVEDKDPARAAAIANAYASELLALTKVIALSEAAQRRQFFERQLESTKNNLANSEMAMKRALSTGVVSVDSESRAMVETSAMLRAQIAAKEVQLGAMQSYMTSNHFEVKKVQEELASIRTELVKLENGGGTPSSGNVDKRAGLDNIKILREVKYHQMLYELLAKQYEVARLDEAKDASIIQVLDPAQVPERRARPKRSLIVAASFVFGLFTAVLLAWGLDAGQRMRRSPGTARQLDALRAALKGK